jgi:hypothetical protein
VIAGWEATRRHLRDIVEMGRQRGRPILVVHAPRLAALDDASAMAFARFHRVDAASLDWDLPGKTLGSLCAALGVPLVDLTARFRATGRPRDFYYPHNGHWNTAGHDQVARWILEEAPALSARAQPPTPR